MQDNLGDNKACDAQQLPEMPRPSALCWVSLDTSSLKHTLVMCFAQTESNDMTMCLYLASIDL